MHLTILQVGQTPDPMQAKFGRRPEQFQKMLAQTGEDFTFETVFVLDGEPLPDPTQVEGVVITGSAASAYENLDWLEPLRAFIRAAYANGTPMLGVCFGHQIMADALGGKVEKSGKGWGIGRHTYAMTSKDDALKDLPNAVSIMASHQDQVVTPPANADTFLASEFTPYAGLVYQNGAAISVQPHPEFDKAYSLGLVELRRNDPLSDDAVRAAAQTLETPVERHELAKGLAKFLIKAGQGRKAQT